MRYQPWQLDERARKLVDREVRYCVSTLVSELVGTPDWANPGSQYSMEELWEVCSQPNGENEDGGYDEYIEALEHWLVSDWLADKLESKGEMILKDFMGLTIWGRTTSGQAIYCDGVMQEIAEELI
eukprot:GHVR01131228.1.p1 GENE.GHVR01131228.1~~GHVR01131228.1.p1  ORF type:complete len:126 (+),score=15.80 GHVR01131228.1:960-1337(+)